MEVLISEAEIRTPHGFPRVGPVAQNQNHITWDVPSSDWIAPLFVVQVSSRSTDISSHDLKI
jgi:hypothetical protein